jgi:hypothetical protein
MWTEGRGLLEISKELTGNRTRNLVSCGAVRQPTAQRRKLCTDTIYCKYPEDGSRHLTLKIMSAAAA